MGDPAAPAFYARRGNAASDWWTLLHPPYTVWHLSYVVLGAAIAPARDWTALAASVLAFFLAVGLAAHALDELQGRPLRTAIGTTTLWTVAVVALAAAVVVGGAVLDERLAGAAPRSIGSTNAAEDASRRALISSFGRPGPIVRENQRRHPSTSFAAGMVGRGMGNACCQLESAYNRAKSYEASR